VTYLLDTNVLSETRSRLPRRAAASSRDGPSPWSARPECRCSTLRSDL